MALIKLSEYEQLYRPGDTPAIKAVRDAIDDLYYINEALDSEGEPKNENQLPESSTL